MKRLTLPTVRPLEIWNLHLPSGSKLSTRLRESGAPMALREALILLLSGPSKYQTICHGIQRVCVAGGAVPDWIDSSLQDSLFSVQRLTEGLWVGVRGGMAIAKSLGYEPREVVVIDWGQTSIKVQCGETTSRVFRDLDKLPLRKHQQQFPVEQQRLLLRALLSASLHNVDRSVKLAIIGVPGVIQDDGSPGKSTYIGLGGDKTLFTDVFAELGLCPDKVYLINDAALACASMLGENEKILLLTFGFGIGGAVYLPTPG